MDNEIVIKLREEQTRLKNLVVAIETLESTSEYELVKSLLFDGLVKKIESRIQAEGLAPVISPEKLYRLQGELALAKKYADLNKYASTLKVELEGINRKLK